METSTSMDMDLSSTSTSTDMDRSSLVAAVSAVSGHGETEEDGFGVRGARNTKGEVVRGTNAEGRRAELRR